MFKKESLYINAIKYEKQLKLDYKKLNENEIAETNSSVFLTTDDVLPLDIALKLNSSAQETEETYISTLLLNDNARLVEREKSSKLKDCEIATFNAKYDIATLKTTLFETKTYFEKTGIDFIYSAFHIMNLHLEKNICKNEILALLINNKVYILLIDKNGQIVHHKTEDLPTIESIKKTHFYDDDIDSQKLFDEVYYLELSQILQNTLNSFYENKNDDFIEKVTILYTLKQFNNTQIENLKAELMLEIEYHPINIEEEIFELSKNKHHKNSFIKPRKKVKKSNFSLLWIILFLGLIVFALFKLYDLYDKNTTEPKMQEVSENIQIPDHVNTNDKIIQRVKAIANSIPYDVVLDEFVLDDDFLLLKSRFLKEDTFITSLKPNLETLYVDNEAELVSKDKKFDIQATVTSKDKIELKNIVYKVNTKDYIIDEFLPIQRVTEQLKILMPKDTIVKFKSSKNGSITKFYYLVNMIVNSPKEFYELIDSLNNEFYSINIMYPISMIKTINGLEIEFNLVFNQPK